MGGQADPSRYELLELARAWLRSDPDHATRVETQQIIDRADAAELADRFGSRLSFGTAGLRAGLGAGPMRLNRLVVRQTAAGVARVLAVDHPGDESVGVIVAHDARTGSEQFAADTVEVLVAHGFTALVIDGPAPTPLAAFAIRHLGASAAIVVTASHNPASENGIKVFWGDGAQIAPPTDQRIASAIDGVAADGIIAATGSTAGQTGSVEHLGTSGSTSPLVEAYLTEAAELVPGAPLRALPLSVTSLHGVGADLLELTLAHFGHGPVHHVESQRAPDPSFPTIRFPNPEEPGALDAVIDLARSTGSVLALANDPDADRLAVAAELRDGSWRPLTGDETGALLASHLLRLTDSVPDRLLATTVVSSRLVGAMARAAGVHFAETLTGFKWLARPALEHPRWTQVMVYEEALGYALGPSARDKDGITAALVAADAACTLAAEGRTVWDVLDDLARAHGAHVTENGSARLEGPGAAERLAELSRSLSANPPVALGGVAVDSLDRPAPDVHRLYLVDGTRVALRPSGTEPKFKYYCEAIEWATAHEEVEAARQRARVRLTDVVEDLRSVLA